MTPKMGLKLMTPARSSRSPTAGQAPQASSNILI